MYIEYKSGEKFPSKDADTSSNHESFKDAGWVLTENDLVVDIDCLSKDVIEKMITIFNINTQIVWTDRGAHLYFKKPESFRGANAVCPLGFPVEYKHIKNTKSITIKRNGVMREIINFGVREDLPDALSNRIRIKESLLGLDEGDGRNNKLYGHKQKVARLTGWKNILLFINNNVFAKPLDHKESETLIRDEKLKAEKDGEYELAMGLISKYKIHRLGKSFYYFDGMKYVTNDDKFNYMIAQECVGRPTKYIKEVIEQIRYNLIPLDDKVFDIKLNNGILRNGKFVEIDSCNFTPYYIDIDYDPNAESVRCVDDYLNHLTDNDENYKKLLLEVLGHTLITNPEFKRQLAKFFVFIGDGGNGKGTLLEIIRRILSRHNCSSLAPKKMTDERYLYSMKGKLANLGDDVDSEPINNDQMKILKNISTCDEISLRKMRENSEDVTLTASLIFTSNHLLKSFEKGESYKRRVMWMPMFTVVKKKEKNFITNLTTKEALEYWLKLIVEAYERLYEQGQFTQSEKVDMYNEEYHLENNGTTMFIEDYDRNYFIGKRPPEVWEVFENWAKENDVSGSPRMLKDEICKIHNLKIQARKINGKSAKVYVCRGWIL